MFDIGGVAVFSRLSRTEDQAHLLDGVDPAAFELGDEPLVVVDKASEGLRDGPRGRLELFEDGASHQSDPVPSPVPERSFSSRLNPGRS